MARGSLQRGPAHLVPLEVSCALDSIAQTLVPPEAYGWYEAQRTLRGCLWASVSPGGPAEFLAILFRVLSIWDYCPSSPSAPAPSVWRGPLAQPEGSGEAS